MISFLNFAMIIEQKSLDVSLDSEKKKKKKILIKIFFFFFLLFCWPTINKKKKKKKRIIIIIFIIFIYILSALNIYIKKKKKQLNLKMGEQWQLVDNIFKQSSTSSTLPYFLEIEEFLTNLIPLICRSFLDWWWKWYSVESIESTVAKSVDVEMIKAWIFTSRWKIWYRFGW